MQLKTYNEILTELCDSFDAQISPNKIARTNTNIIYLLLKSIAKGMEIVVNIVYTLSNKFNPAYCSDEDLESVAKLVGTERMEGSGTGLQINVTNNGGLPVTLFLGVYEYKLDDDNIFHFTVNEDVEIPAGESTYFIAISTENKPVPVTEQANITVTSLYGTQINSNLQFSCDDNAGLQGTERENILDFRKRIIEGDTTASMLDKLQAEIKQLPYIFDCQLFFNSSTEEVVKSGVPVPPWHLLIVISGNPDSKVAEIVTKHSIFPTVVTNDFVTFYSNVMIDGQYKVYYKTFEPYRYDIRVLYKSDSTAISNNTIENAFYEALIKYKNSNTYTPLVTEQMFANILANLGLSSVQILNVDLYDREHSETVDFIEVPLTYIAKLENITINRRGE